MRLQTKDKDNRNKKDDHATPDQRPPFHRLLCEALLCRLDSTNNYLSSKLTSLRFRHRSSGFCGARVQQVQHGVLECDR